MNAFSELKDWTLRYKREIILFVLIFLVSSISFGLGYLYANQTNRAPIIIEKTASD